MIKNKQNETEFWKDWWNKRAGASHSDYEVDRGQSIKNKAYEKQYEKELLSFIDPHKDYLVLDAGCGTGINCSRVSTRVREVYGMDMSKEMINRARKRISTENLANVKLFVGSISETGFPNNTFDMILCMSVMQYLDDEECEKALAEIVRVAKDGATIVLHVKNLFSLYLSTLLMAKKIKKIFTNKVKIEHYRPYTWYENKLKNMGAIVEKYHSYNIFLIDFLPSGLLSLLQRIEMQHYKSRLFRRYGADYYIKAKVSNRIPRNKSL